MGSDISSDSNWSEFDGSDSNGDIDKMKYISSSTGRVAGYFHVDECRGVRNLFPTSAEHKCNTYEGSSIRHIMDTRECMEA